MNIFRLSKFINLDDIEKIEDIKKNDNNIKDNDIEINEEIEYLKKISNKDDNRKASNNLNSDDKGKDIYYNINNDKKNENETNNLKNLWLKQIFFQITSNYF